MPAALYKHRREGASGSGSVGSYVRFWFGSGSVLVRSALPT